MPRVSDFVEAICESPGDDTPRLIYADFLEEHGDLDRAEFIRLQCERAQLPVWDRRAKELRYREWLLLCKNSRRWHQELPVIDGVTWGRFERGFVSEIKVPSLGHALSRQAEILQASPICGVRTGPGVSEDLLRTPCAWLEKLWITDPDNCDEMQQSDFLTHEALENLKGLFLEGGNSESDRLCSQWFKESDIPAIKILRVNVLQDGNAFFQSLLSNSRLRNLEGLGVRFGPATENSLTAETMEGFVHSQTSRNLKHLSFTGNSESLELANHLLSDSQLENLESLEFHRIDLSGTFNELDSREQGPAPRLESLTFFDCKLSGPLSVPYLQKLIPTSIHAINLCSNPIDAEFWSYFRAQKWPRLHSLNLGDTFCDDDTVQTLAETNALPDILELDLSSNRLGPVKAAHALAVAPWTERLRILRMGNNRLQAGYLLSQNHKLMHLWWLSLAGNPLGVAGITALCEGDWKELTILDVARSFEGDVGVEPILHSAFMHQLRLLDIGGCRCGNATLRSLVQLPARLLVQLSMNDNNLTAAGISAFVERPLPNLRGFQLRNSKIGRTGCEVLYQSPLFRQLDVMDVWGASVPTSLGRVFGKLSPYTVKPIWDVSHRFNHDPFG